MQSTRQSLPTSKESYPAIQFRTSDTALGNGIPREVFSLMVGKIQKVQGRGLDRIIEHQGPAILAVAPHLEHADTARI